MFGTAVVVAVLSCICSTYLVSGQIKETYQMPIVAMVPYNDHNCTQTALEMAFEDVNKVPDIMSFVDETQNISRVHKLSPVYLKTSENLLETLSNLNNLLKMKPTKLGVIGTPFIEQNAFVGSLLHPTRLPHLVYSEVYEPMSLELRLLAVSPPSMSTRVPALKSLLSLYNWTKIGVLVDFSDPKYNRIASTLTTMIEEKDEFRMKINIVEEQPIRKLSTQRSLSSELNIFQEKGIRINIMLAGVEGARKVFCEAYHRKMYRPKVIWILFETLPEDWASSKYDAWATKNNDSYNMEREIKCTEEELLTAADGYISITKQGLRRDGERAINNMTVDDFRARLRNRTGHNKCSGDVGYAYDAVWITAKAYGSFNFDVNYFEGNVQVPIDGIIDFLGKGIEKLQFEGITGSIRYEALYHNIAAARRRIGPNSVSVFKKNTGLVYLATHDPSNNTLHVVPNIQDILFTDGIIPKDGPTLYNDNHNMNQDLLYTMWVFAILGVFFSVVLFTILILSRKCKKDDNKEVGEIFETPMVDYVMLFGSILCYLSIIVYGTDTRFIGSESIPSVCTAFVCLLSVGFTICFGALFVKTWSIYRMFIVAGNKVNPGKTTEQTENIPEWIMLFIMFAWLIADVIILISWFLVSPFVIDIRDVTENTNLFDDIIIYQKIVGCACEKEIEFQVAMYVSKGILVIIGVFLAWQMRKTSDSMQPDCKDIQMAIYNSVICCIIGILSTAILRANSTSHDAVYAILAICILVAVTTTLILVFTRKIFMMWKLRTKKKDEAAVVDKPSSSRETKVEDTVKESEEKNTADVHRLRVLSSRSVNSDEGLIPIDSKEKIEIQKPPPYECLIANGMSNSSIQEELPNSIPIPEDDKE